MRTVDYINSLSELNKEDLKEMNTAKDIMISLEKFISTADKSDIKGLSEVLHDDYRNVQYGFFGEPGVQIIDKQIYLKLVENKTFGGVPRDIEILNFKLFENTAMIQVKLESKDLTFNSFVGLVRESENQHWQVIENFPYVTPTNK